MDPGSAVAIASALIAGLDLLLTQVHLRKAGASPRERERLREALLQLEAYLAGWADQAKVTNRDARMWAEDPAAKPGTALGYIVDTMQAQTMYVASVEWALSSGRPELIPPAVAGDPGEEHASLERLLRVYAPDFYEFLVAFSRRREQLDTMVIELERRRAEEGDTLEAYLGELDQAADQLEEARRRLAEFIANEFPLVES
jgi:hypothetical protein